ncbi:glycerol-1-phosphatase [Kockovaella imperatae]|uniref:Glycerol-1-phosphatase n=1 Tax=Kockovaella imperatae TaxID=4999 RepID=A0A1Y1UH84_9TREE|nr:glycerol-1-phosphatase [Kockovaella imperatae]ORX37349.1 glycerol-1-phosphatase [Kockovaella imperatae]
MGHKSETTAKCLLFDMDGTLIDSTPAVDSVWEAIAKKYDLDLKEVLKTCHGRRTVDSLKKWCGITDPEELEKEVNHFESMIVTRSKELKDEGKRGLEILPGVKEMLETLNDSHKPIWAICTSATSAYAGDAIPSTGLPKPPHLITAEDVHEGKPDPAPYIAGAKALDVECKDCIVFEDAPSGIKSGVNSGARVLAVCTSHKRDQIENLGAEWIVTDLTKVKIRVEDSIVHLEIDETP